MNRQKIVELKPTVWIGKKGCTDVVIEEILNQVKSRKIVKIRLLKSVDIDPKAIASLTGTKIIDIRGRTIVLGKEEKKGNRQPARNV